MKFLHMADCHLGGWRDAKLMDLSLKAFNKAIDTAISEKVDFVLIAGDLFDTAIPNFNIVKQAIKKLVELKHHNIECYIIPGSHDSSVTGSSFIDILEVGKICKNVDFSSLNPDYFKDKPYILVGLAGKRRNLEVKDIEAFKQNVNNMRLKYPDKKLILTMHTNVSELLPHELENLNLLSISIKDLPKADYYALGHIHTPFIYEIKNKKSYAVYPGPTFPNSFDELINGYSQIAIVKMNDNSLEIKTVKLDEHKIIDIEFNANNKTPYELTEEIIKKIENESFDNKIATLKIKGKLRNGRPSEIDIERISNSITEKGAYVLVKNMNALTSSEFELKTDLNIESTNSNLQDIEKEVVKSYLQNKKDKVAPEQSISGQLKSQDILSIISYLDIEKKDGETNKTFCDRVIEHALKLDIEGTKLKDFLK